MINVNIVDVEPVLEVFDFDKSILFYTKTLGFNLDWTWPETGPKEHGSVSFGGNPNDHSIEHFHLHLSKSETKVTPSGWIYIRIGPEIDDLYDYYKSLNVSIIVKLDNYPWQMREFMIEDIDVNRIKFDYNYLEH